MDSDMHLIERIADGRTDLVSDWLAQLPRAATLPPDHAALLQWCAYYGDVSAVRLLLGHGAFPEALGENLGLHAAAFHGHWPLCEFLLERGADVNAAASPTGETALHAAFCTPDRGAPTLVLRILLAYGADPNRATVPGIPTGAFMRDCRTRGETPLHRAAAYGSEEAIDLILQAGASVEARDAHGDTPLAWASWHGRPDAVLRRLCYGDLAIPPDRLPLRLALLGRPRGHG